MLRVLIINLIVLIPLVLSQKPGPCPRISGVPLDASQMAGPWYPNRRTTLGVDDALECSRFEWYPLIESNFTSRVACISTLYDDNPSVIINGYDNGYRYRHRVDHGDEIDLDLYALGVDYDRWRILWTCKNYGNFHSETARVFTREPCPNDVHLEKFIDQTFTRWGLQKPRFTKIDHHC